MCYTHLTCNDKKILKGGCWILPTVSKLGVSSMLHVVIAKTIKYSGMPCCVQVEYRVFFCSNMYCDHVKNNVKYIQWKCQFWDVR